MEGLDLDLKKVASLWVDRKSAIVVVVSEHYEEILEIRSNLDKYSGPFVCAASPVHHDPATLGSEGRSPLDLNTAFGAYYEKIVDAIWGASVVFLFGTGGSQGELKQHLDRARFEGRAIEMGKAEGMTDLEIATMTPAGFFD